MLRWVKLLVKQISPSDENLPKFFREMVVSDSMDLMEQKVHELDARLRQMKEERDQVIAENDELQVRRILRRKKLLSN